MAESIDNTVNFYTEELELRGYVVITRAEHDSLKESERTLGLLERGGVDNWEWYGEALRGGLE